MTLKKLPGRYLLKALIIVGIIVVFTLLVTRLFPMMVRTYAVNVQQSKVSTLIAQLEAEYQQDTWKPEALRVIGEQGTAHGYIFNLKDTKGKLVWNGTASATKESPQLHNNIVLQMKMLIPGWEGKPKTINIPLTKADRQIGTLELTAVDPFFLTNPEIIFLMHFERWLFIVIGITLLIAVVLLWWNKKSFQQEMQKVGQAAKRLVTAQPLEEELLVSERNEVAQVLSSLKNCSEQLLEQELDKVRITHDLAHELRTPLTTLQANLELMAEGLVESNPERLQSCHEEILRIIRLVGELEQLNKFEFASMQLTLEEFDIGEMLANLCHNFEGVYQQKGVSLKFTGASELIVGDKDKLKQLMVNLLSNSLKYTNSGGQVLLLINGNSEFVYIVLNDNGIGIPQQDLPRVFERLYRADTSRTRATGGAGIGLTIAKAITQAHQGSINIVSQVGKGTEVSLVLPRKKLEE